LELCVRLGLAYSQSQSCVDTASASHASVKEIKISIVGVEFQGENPFPDSLRAQLAEEIQHSELWAAAGEPDSIWISDALTPTNRSNTSWGIEFLGLGTAAQKSLTAAQEIREPFNRALWENFFEANRTHLPADVSLDENMRVVRNVSTVTVDVTLDFRPCLKTQALN
jgi:hypothetical protein